VKIWKPFGLQVKDHHGNLVGVDDERLDPIWETAARLSMPVLIHVADPVAFLTRLMKPMSAGRNWGSIPNGLLPARLIRHSSRSWKD